MRVPEFGLGGGGAAMVIHRHGALAAVLLVSVIHVAPAQVFKLEEMPVPPHMSLQGVYAFYVYAAADAPSGKQEPVVKFKELVAKTSTQELKCDAENDCDGLQLSILPYKDFWKVVDPEAFCSTPEDVNKGRAKQASSLLLKDPESTTKFYSHAVKFNDPLKDTEANLDQTDVYVLIFSNCGHFDNATVSGEVVVQNPYGFLPGNEYHKLSFNGWLAIAWLLFAAVWIGLSVSYGWSQLSSVQHCITAVAMMGLLEAAIWWFFLHDWNQSGERWGCLFSVAVLCSVMKSVLSYSFLLLVSMGWVLMQSGLDDIPIKRITLMSSLYLVYGFFREHVLSLQHAYAFLPSYVFLVELPMPILAGCIFLWTFSALSGIIDTLRDRRETERLALAQHTRTVFTAGVALASLPTMGRFFLLIQDSCEMGMLSVSAKCVKIEWHMQWFMVDGSLRVLFLIVLIMMMFLWAPSKTASWYSYEDLPVGKEVESAIWADEDLPEDDDTGTKDEVAPEKIGADDRRGLE